MATTGNVTPATIVPEKGQPLLDCDGLPVSRHKDVFVALVADHAHLRHLVDGWDAELASARNGERLAQIARHFVHDVSTHDAFEKAYIEPLYVAKLGAAAGGTITTRAAQDDASEAKELAQLAALDIVNNVPAAASLFARIKAGLNTHMTAEETQWWPELHAKMSHAELEALHKAYINTKTVLPTHPHPLLLNAPPLVQKLAGPVVGIADRAFDALTGFGKPTSGSSVQTGPGVQTGPSVQK